MTKRVVTISARSGRACRQRGETFWKKLLEKASRKSFKKKLLEKALRKTLRKAFKVRAIGKKRA